MKESQYNFLIALRLMITLLPILLGMPMLAYCFCAYNLCVIVVSRGPVFGLITGLTASGCGALMCAAVGYGWAYGVFFALQIILTEALVSVTVVARRGFASGLVMASVGYGVGDLLNMKYQASDAGLSIADNMTSSVDEYVSQTFSLYAQQLEKSGSTVDFDPEKLSDAVINAVKTCVPAVFVIGCIVAGYVVMWMVTKSLRGTPLANGHSFAGIRLPAVSTLFGAAMLGMAFVPQQTAAMIGVNGFIVFIFLEFFGGLSLMEYFLRTKVQSPFVRVVIHVGIFLAFSMISAIFPLANIFLLYALVGITDGFVSIRKRVAAGNENE